MTTLYKRNISRSVYESLLLMNFVTYGKILRWTLTKTLTGEFEIGTDIIWIYINSFDQQTKVVSFRCVHNQSFVELLVLLVVHKQGLIKISRLIKVSNK